MKARKKPVEIECVQYHMFQNESQIESFVGNSIIYESGGLCIKTLEGVMHISDGDYVIKGVNGEFYPCKPDIFEATYDIL